MQKRFIALIATFGLAGALALTGCAPGTPPPGPSAPNVDAPAAVDPGDSGPAKESMVDPAWPWPADVLRPAGVTYEFTAKNPLGEGGIWQVDFHVGSLDEAQAFAHALEADGWEFFLGNEGIIEEDSASWVLSRGDLMGTLSTENPQGSPIVMSFTLMGLLN